MVKLFLGLLKGLIIGGAIGYGAYAAGLGGGWNWVTYGLVGAFVGLLVGKPIWSNILDKNATTWVSILKAMFGFGVGCGVYALVNNVWGGFRLHLDFLEPGARLFQDWQPVFGAALGAVYGAFVELDDSLDDSKAKPKKLPEPAVTPPTKPAAKK
jgi:Na+/proline symporter